MFKADDEADYITKLFRNAFVEYKEKKILLYGLGINTKVLLQNKNDFNIIGVMDAKHEGELFEGVEVFSEDKAKKNADIIVIVARAAVVPIIYGRIEYLEQFGIGIYDVSGTNLHKTSRTYAIPHNATAEEIRKEILEHDIVCFDVFDTLIVRKIVLPEDIFDIVENRLKRKGMNIAFSQTRKQASHIAYKEKTTPCLKDIYDVIRFREKLAEDEINEMMQEELMTELDYIVPRTSIISLFKYAKDNKKKVFLISDMYLNSSQIERLLEQCGVRNYDKLFVSCEYGKRKWPDGELYQEVKKWCGQGAVLHIGDSEGADVLCARKSGINAIKILSIYETIVNSPFQVLLSHNRTLGDSIAIGVFSSKYLQNPFIVLKNKGILYLKEKRDLGFICYGPLVVGFLAWVRKTAESKGMSYIAFMARDGWILEKVWDILSKENKILNFPEARYILGSRRAVTVPAMRDRKDVEQVLQRVPGTMKNVDMMKLRFGIECPKTVDKNSKEECICDYMDDILKNAEKERQEYQKYINKMMGQDGYIAVIDAVSTGTIGKYFFEATDRQGCLLCMLISNVPDYSVCDEINVEAYMGEDAVYSPKWNIHKHLGKLEGILTAPVPMFLFFDEKGDEKYGEPELSQQNKEILQEVQDGIIRYSQEWSRYLSDLETDELSPRLADAFFGLFYEDGACCIEDVVQKLGVSDIY